MMKTMLERLLGHLHRAVFDTSPERLTAFYLDGPAGSSWVAANENFDITFADGRIVHFDLNEYQIWEFITALRNAGMTVTAEDANARYFAGITMLELSGEAGKPNPIVLYKDILHAIFGAYSREMRIAREQVTQSLNQLNIKTADDGFLEQWGTQFGIAREGAADTDYRVKIPREAFRVRLNSFAIEKAVKDQTGYNIQLEEPWRDVFRLDLSLLSGAQQLYKDSEVGYFLVQPVAYTKVDWDRVLPIIKRNLAAGVICLDPKPRYRIFSDDPLNGTIWWQEWSIRSTFLYISAMPKLDDGIVLSGGYEIVLNYSCAQTKDWTGTLEGEGIKGTVRFDPSRTLIYTLEHGDYPLWEYHTANKLGNFLELYPADPRTWRIGGWDRDATWNKPYNWRVHSRSSKLESQFFCPAYQSYDVKVYSEISGGVTWADLPDWNDEDWVQGSEYFYPAWFDASNNFTPKETALNVWEMTVSRAKKAIFNVGIRSYDNRQMGTLVTGVTYALKGAPVGNAAVITTVNDHTFSVNTTRTGDMTITITGTQASTGMSMDTKLILHIGS